MKNRPNVELMKAELTEPIADVLKEKVSIRNLDFFYGDYRALKSISLPLYDRKVTAFIGPSGCGKSTLLRVLNRMYDLYPGQRATGEVLLEGRNVIDPKTDVNQIGRATRRERGCQYGEISVGPES